MKRNIPLPKYNFFFIVLVGLEPDSRPTQATLQANCGRRRFYGPDNNHDAFKVSAIRSIDGSQNPASYSNIITITNANSGYVTITVASPGISAQPNTGAQTVCQYDASPIISVNCTTASNVSGLVTVNSDNTAGVASSSPTLCINSVLTNITHTTQTIALQNSFNLTVNDPGNDCKAGNIGTKSFNWEVGRNCGTAGYTFKYVIAAGQYTTLGDAQTNKIVGPVTVPTSANLTTINQVVNYTPNFYTTQVFTLFIYDQLDGNGQTDINAGDNYQHFILKAIPNTSAITTD